MDKVMSKYIDADKLLAEIKGLQCEQGFEDGMEERGYQFAIKDIHDIITSLQQEQPEFVKEIWHKVSEEANLTRPVVLSDGDKYMSPPCTFPFKDMSGFVKAMNKKYKADYTIWAYMDDLLNISSLQQEQPEVDLEKEIERIVENEERFMKFQVKEQLIKYVARHFAEWGAIHLNARKEGSK